MEQKLKDEVINNLKWRNIGPPRGGRTVAVAGHPTNLNEYYFGACAGGVWKTDDAGISWKNVSDGFFNTSSARFRSDISISISSLGFDNAKVRSATFCSNSP